MEQVNALVWAQTQLDYHLDEGGFITELENQIGDKIQSLLDLIKTDMGNTQANIKIRIPELGTWMQALEEAMAWTPTPKPPLVDHLGFLRKDYQLWGKELKWDPEQTNPMNYLEDLFEVHEQVPKSDAKAFLSDWYDEDAIEEWAAKIAWDEDEKEMTEEQWIEFMDRHTVDE
jgi:hypothetical protein